MLPEVLKIAKVIPIYKGDDAANPDNYRPISPSSVFDKLSCQAKRCKLRKFSDRMGYTYVY